ncbi:D-isomer specific 2-hydroxyacid dehydrogenase [Xylariaceae sp. FL1651]|nr:D-isomer specific 2-hydroxyacid dehydrogenase [Xylariaceae sp. FL1651]
MVPDLVSGAGNNGFVQPGRVGIVYLVTASTLEIAIKTPGGVPPTLNSFGFRQLKTAHPSSNIDMALPTIAILDDYQEISNPHFEQLRSSGYQVTTFTDTLLPYNHLGTPQDAKDALVKRLEPFNIICSMRERTPFPADLINRLPNLKLLLTTGPRNASIDVKACQARGIPVAGTGLHGKFSGPDSTTQHCVALTLALARNIPQDDAAMKSGGWQTRDAVGMAGKVFGTVGLGRLGASVSRIMHLAFGMRVIAWSANLTQEAADEKAKAAGLPVEDENGAKTFKVVSRDELFSTADVVNIHLVLSERSRGLVGISDLQKMKKSALLVNTSRGPIVNEDELLEAAKKGLIRGIGLDVYSLEPLPKDSEWRTTKWGESGRSQVVLTPHMGYVEAETIGNWYEQHVENILRWQKGETLAAVYKDSGY